MAVIRRDMDVSAENKTYVIHRSILNTSVGV